MNQSDAHRLLSAGPSGIQEFNQQRQAARERVYLKLSLPNRDLSSVDFGNLILEDSDFTQCNLRNAILKNADLTRAKLRNADLRGIHVDSKTSLLDATVDGAIIDTFTLARLTHNGGLTTGDRMSMHIVDDARDLQAHYVGLWRPLHFLALVLFFFPYAWFLVFQYHGSRTAPPTSDSWWATLVLSGERLLGIQSHWIPIRTAFARYIYNGGDFSTPINGWPHWTFYVLLFSMLYNCVRATLLIKAHSLDRHRADTGLPPVFSFDWSMAKLGSWSVIHWRHIYHAALYGFFINLALVALHTFHFLSRYTEVP